MKDESTYLSIGQFSRLTQISVRMLRYYGEYGVLEPAAVDEWTGYRYYHPQQLTAALRVRDLRDCGLGVAEIAEALTYTPDRRRQLLSAQREILEEALRDLRGQLELCNRLLNEEETPMTVTISRKIIPAMHVVTYTGVVPSYADEGQLWEQMLPLLQEQGIAITGPCGVIEHSTEYQERDVTLSIFVPVAPGAQAQAPLELLDLPARDCVVAHLIGPYSEIKEAHDQIAAYLAEHNLGSFGGDTLAAKTFNVYLTGPGGDPAQYMTDIHVPICCVKDTECCEEPEGSCC